MLLRKLSSLLHIARSSGDFQIEISKQATLELLSLFYFSISVGYAIWLIVRGFAEVALLTLIYSALFLVLVPASRKWRFTSDVKSLLFFTAGLPFSVINIFFCGSSYSIQIVLWVVFSVNISFLILSVKKAFIFGCIVTSLLIARQYMTYYGYFGSIYLLPKQLVEYPDFVDILVPALFNLAATSTFYILYQNSLQAILTSSGQINQANLKLTETLVSLDSARRRAEESDKLKSLFLANISHELKTPLNAIMGFSEILTKPMLDDQKRIQYAAQIQIGSKKLFTMIMDILDYSKIETGSTTLIETQGMVSELIIRVVASARADQKLTGKQVALNSRWLTHEDNQPVIADFFKLNQVLTNLIDNAIKFTSNGEILVSATKNAEMIEFSVSDTGIGIASDRLEKIFEPFMHGDDSIHGLYGGKGLGLTICRGLVTQWGGKIWVESTLNQGTTVRFTLPIKSV